ncbi:MAG: GGDEF domain-containing protein [Actinobacteria bacterium]|nr:GGDEF domain-containing protein [Actinomycetota bacterium]
MREQRFLRLSLPILIFLHLIGGQVFNSANALNEVFLYNLIIVLIVYSIVRKFDGSNQVAIICTSIAFGLWGIGSIISSISTFYTLSTHTVTIANAFYLLFYPFAFIGLPRIAGSEKKLLFLEIMDASIIGLGLSALATAFLIKPVLPHFDGDLASSFFSICFPVADLILIAVTSATFLTQLRGTRTLFLGSGILVFALSDFLFLWQLVNGSYRFGSLVDNGWLIGFVLISESLSHKREVIASQKNINPILLTASVFLSATLLALVALHPGYFPSFILIPTIATLLLAFFRMTIALREARSIGEERILARTDELTGLPNRRKLIGELELFADKNGALLLLDLNGFKLINDSHGHDIGDIVLQQVAGRFSRALPSNALLARLGGDEFGVIITGSYEHTMDVALALHATLSYPFLIRGESINIGVSIGHITNDGSQDLLRKADLAMYQAKREGIGVFAG